MWRTIIFQLLLFYIFVGSRGWIQRAAQRRSATFTMHAENTKLNSGLISSENSLTLLYCMQSCLSRHNCKSINYKASSMECEVLSESAVGSRSDLLLKTPGWDHYTSLPSGRCDALDVRTLCSTRHVCKVDDELLAGYKCRALENIALGRPALQSSTCYEGHAARAVDGNSATIYSALSCTHTCKLSSLNWWRVDFGRSALVHAVEITNRGDCCGYMLSNFNIRIGDSEDAAGGNNEACAISASVPPGGTKLFLCRPKLSGRYLYISQNVNYHLALCEVKALGEFV